MSTPRKDPVPKPIRGSVGGWKGHPNSIRLGLVHRVKIGDPRHRLCSRCGRLAMRDSMVCMWHGGGVQVADPGRLASRAMGRMDRRGLLPAELVALPLWRELGRLRTAERAPARLALVQSWDWRDTHPLVWARVWREARRTLETGVILREWGGPGWRLAA